MDSTRLTEVLNRIDAAAAASGRTGDAITLVAVSKGRPDSAVLEVYRQGHRTFGENRQQGLASRIKAGLPDDISWHFIGPLQGRKARFVSEHVALLHSFDRLDLIRRWDHSDTPVLLQFNMANEPQKGGFAPTEAERALNEVMAAGITVRGVMAIPPAVDDPNDARRWFAGLRSIYDRLRFVSPEIDTLSMGMSHDFEVAIQEGATTVRVGTAIFGPIQISERNG
ncbi:MAG: YggS family pyridoxal phosphate-dependent enzyme [Acidimicrobiia bacterium]|nr:YggS family pyridoxal phosphate-dependent enzyme [Acidimicrobiia bacterium]